MNFKLQATFCLLNFLFAHFSFTQTLINGDLENQYCDISTAPPGWEMVSFTDPNCEATVNGTDTPDIYAVDGPEPGFGLYGIPYSGNTFVAGVYGNQIQNGVFSQEGIKQTVSGFEIDSTYVIGFFQTVRVRNSLYDPSGSWVVIVDDQVIGVTEPTITSVGMFELTLQWEKRELIFTASSTTHTLKFLPIDNDDVSISMESGENGAVCMAIDSVYLKKYSCDKSFDLGSDLVFCEGDSAKIDAYQVNAAFDWNTGEASSNIIVDTSGFYTVAVTVFDCPLLDSITYFDTVQVTVVTYPVFDFGDEIQFICANEILILDAYSENSAYLWQDGSNESSFSVIDTGLYFVHVERMGCHWSDSVKIELKPCESIFEMPNVFTPNGDGVNDIFEPFKSKGIVLMYTVIMNRWGELVFESDDINIQWEGIKEDGSIFSTGVYFWMVNFLDEFGEPGSKNGFVQLVR